MVKIGKIIQKNQLLLVGAGIIITILFIASSGMLSGVFNFEGFSFPQTPLAPLQPETEFLSYNVTVDIQPNPVCLGDNITATINSTIPNGVCSIYIDNGTGFSLLTNINLNAEGTFTTNEPMYALGIATFRTICCDTDGNCRIGNDITLTVTNTSPPCPTGPAPPPLPDSDGDSFTDEEEIAAGTNPNDPNDYPGSSPPDEEPTEYTCGQTTNCFEGTCPTGYFCAGIESQEAEWCACITGGNGEPGTVHPDWKPGGLYYDPWN